MEFRSGWKQVVAGQPSAALFRLSQNVDSTVARNALEELGRSRDAATLDQLFKWLLDPVLEPTFFPFDSYTAVVRLAPGNPAVYDRAWKALEAEAPGTNAYRLSSLACLCALADEQRAIRDLASLLTGKSLEVRKAALVGLGNLPRRDAMQLCLDRLRDEQLSESAAASLLGRRGDYRLPKGPGLEDDDWLMRQLLSATFDDRVPEPSKKMIRTRMAHGWRDVPRFSAGRLLPHLTRLADPSYRGWSDAAAKDLFEQARAVCDPEVIPKLVEAIDNVPAASGHKALHDAIQFYALVCPQTTRRELGKSRLLADTPTYLIRSEVLAAVETASMKADLPPIRLSNEVDRCFVLARQVRDGSANVDELLRSVDGLVNKLTLASEALMAVPALLESGHPRGRQRYLRTFLMARQPRVYRDHQFIGSELTSLLHRLFPDRASDYYDQVLELLASPSLLERKAGVDSLTFTLLSDFDFDPEALEAERSRQMARIRPLLRSLEGKNEIQARATLLKAAGVALHGDSADGWLQDLPQAAGSADQNVARNALRLVDLIIGYRRCASFEQLTPRLRARAVTLYLRDAGRLGALVD